MALAIAYSSKISTKSSIITSNVRANLCMAVKLIIAIPVKSALSVAAVEQLREAYKHEKYLWENF